MPRSKMLTARHEVEGWKNEAAWRLNLTIDNNPTLYVAKIAFLRCLTMKLPIPHVGSKEESIRAFCSSLSKSGSIVPQLCWDVDWAELTESWLELAKTL